MLLLKVRFPQNNLCLSWSSIFRAGSCFVRFYILLYFPSFPLLETENCKICINFHSWDIWQKYKSWSLIYSLNTDVLTRFPEMLRMKEETNVLRLSKNRSEWSTKQRKQDHHYQSLRVIGRNWLGDHECQGSESPYPSSPLGIIILFLPFKISGYHFCLPLLDIIILISPFETIKDYFCSPSLGTIILILPFAIIGEDFDCKRG